MKKIIIAVLSVLAGVAIIIGLAKVFSPGSYANTEDFHFSMEKDSLIGCIEMVKNERHYVPPEDLQLNDGYGKSPDYWYHIYMFVDGVIFHLGIARIYGEDKTTLALMNIKDLQKDASKWYRMDELDRADRKQIMDLYRHHILDNLHVLYD
ncbi:hypothetical protein [Taibaiella soli]|uniref:Uncharacterized protein n=1 Tax=Taibaiella soli TaxID=1649169 RepID=A0A2W2AN47_9BACT|nr:hypothetical protein [Taibaiella soli]PZF73750.1 hypothetical protein DN068_07065 [Taibaiella soli]